MEKNKKNNIKIKLFCLNCQKNNNNKNKKFSPYFYSTLKNKKNTKNKLEISKYCIFCKKHTIHKEQ